MHAMHSACTWPEALRDPSVILSCRALAISAVYCTECRCCPAVIVSEVRLPWAHLAACPSWRSTAHCSCPDMTAYTLRTQSACQLGCYRAMWWAMRHQMSTRRGGAHGVGDGGHAVRGLTQEMPLPQDGGALCALRLRRCILLRQRRPCTAGAQRGHWLLLPLAWMQHETTEGRQTWQHSAHHLRT